MPGLSWSSLNVVAADGLVGKRGIALRTPILRNEEGSILLPSSVDDETVTPRRVLPSTEYQELLDGEVWIPLRVLEAKRGHVIVLRSASFRSACNVVPLSGDLRWLEYPRGVTVAYVDRASAVSWRAQCAERFVKRAERLLGEHLCFDSPVALEKAQSLLEQALFVADQGTPKRQRIFVLLGSVVAESSSSFTSSWPILEATVLVETPGLDHAQLNEQIQTARRELKARCDSPRKPPPWAGGHEQISYLPSIR
jgi:hypothetical protein